MDKIVRYDILFVYLAIALGYPELFWVIVDPNKIR